MNETKSVSLVAVMEADSHPNLPSVRLHYTGVAGWHGIISSDYNRLCGCICCCAPGFDLMGVWVV